MRRNYLISFEIDVYLVIRNVILVINDIEIS